MTQILYLSFQLETLPHLKGHILECSVSSEGEKKIENLQALEIQGQDKMSPSEGLVETLSVSNHLSSLFDG